MIALVTHSHLQIIHIYPYLDDLLIRSPSSHYKFWHTQQVHLCLKSHDFLVNIANSQLIQT